MGLNDNKIQFIFEHLQDIAENDELEFKGAKGGFPGSFWETYSSFANTNGGLIVLGIREKNGQFIPDGLTDEDIDKLTKDLWSGLGNRNTISINLLNNADVQPLRKEDVRILVIRIPRAQRDQKPVHVVSTLMAARINEAMKEILSVPGARSNVCLPMQTLNTPMTSEY